MKDATITAMAKEMLEAVVALEGIVPGFAPHDPEIINRVASRAKFANELIGPTIITVTNSPSIEKRRLFDVERGRAALQFRDELRPLAQRLAAFVAGLEFTIDSRLAEAGQEALQTYHWAKRAAKEPGGQDLIPYLEEIKRVVKKVLNRRTKSSGERPPDASRSEEVGNPDGAGDARAHDGEPALRVVPRGDGGDGLGE